MKEVFKISHLISGYSTKDELIVDTLNDFIDNNYAIYGWNMKEPFLQMKRGDLLVLHSSLGLKYIGEVTLPPHQWKFYNPLNVPFLDSIDDKIADER